MKKFLEHRADGLGMRRIKAALSLYVKAAVAAIAQRHEIIVSVIPHRARHALAPVIDVMDVQACRCSAASAGVAITVEDALLSARAEGNIFFRDLPPIGPLRAALYGLQCLLVIKLVLARLAAMLTAAPVNKRLAAFGTEPVAAFLPCHALALSQGTIGAFPARRAGVAIPLGWPARLKERTAVRASLFRQAATSAAVGFKRARSASLAIGAGRFNSDSAVYAVDQMGVVMGHKVLAASAFLASFILPQIAFAGSFPTSFIPTSASQVTRAAEVVTAPLPAACANGGTMQADAIFTAGSPAENIAEISTAAGDSNNRVQLFVTAGSKLSGFVSAAGSTILNAASGSNVSLGTLNRSNAAWGPLTYAYANGTLLGKAGAGVPASLGKIYIGEFHAGNFQINGWMQRLFINCPPLAQSRAQQNSVSK